MIEKTWFKKERRKYMWVSSKDSKRALFDYVLTERCPKESDFDLNVMRQGATRMYDHYLIGGKG